MLNFLNNNKILGKKKKTKEPPAIGPFAFKIHLADNAINIYDDGAKKNESFDTMHQTVDLFLKYCLK